MNHLLDDDDELSGRKEREVTLSTASILGIFFGLVLLCGLFFGLGYSMGGHKPVTTVADNDAAPATSSTNFSTFKPAAGSPAGGSAPSASNTASPLPPVTPPVHTSVPVAPAPAAAARDADDEPAQTPAPVVRPPALTLTRPAAVPPPVSQPATGSFLVQVAAVSHEEDANLLVGALKGKGYAVAARTEPQDKLFHIQVGPFSNRKDADAMRQRLLADGYNALIK